MTPPRLYIIAGCNGAGKTTASFTVLPDALDCREFVNADEIARGLSPFNPEEMAIDAGRLMLKRIQQLIAERRTFAIETTLATRSYRNTVRRAHAAGYEVILLFFWLPSRVWHSVCATEAITSHPPQCGSASTADCIISSRFSCRLSTTGPSTTTRAIPWQ